MPEELGIGDKTTMLQRIVEEIKAKMKEKEMPVVQLSKEEIQRLQREKEMGDAQKTPSSETKKEPSAYEVLREHIDFLREQLTSRQTWQDETIKTLREENAQLKRMVGNWQQLRTSLEYLLGSYNDQIGKSDIGARVEKLLAEVG